MTKESNKYDVAIELVRIIFKPFTSLINRLIKKVEIEYKTADGRFNIFFVFIGTVILYSFAGSEWLCRVFLSFHGIVEKPPHNPVFLAMFPLFLFFVCLFVLKKVFKKRKL